MRSLPELRDQAEALGLPITEEFRREDIMDLIRDHFGHGDEMQIDPMKAQDLKKKIAWGTDDPFKGISNYFTSDYVMEPKLDGARMRLFITPSGTRMNTGRRSDETYAYIERSDNFLHLKALCHGRGPIILDGEIISPKPVITTETGTVTKGILNASVALVNTNPSDSWKTQLREGKALFYAFDILAVEGRDITSLGQSARYQELQNIVYNLQDEYGDDHLKLIPQLPSSPMFIEYALEAGYEGVMIKHKNGLYMPGKRSSAWQKVKRMHTIDCYITGFLPGKGKNEGKVGALKCSVKDHLGSDVEIAQPGAFTDEFRDELTSIEGTLDPKWENKVIEVMAQEVTKNQKLRHPQFMRLRPDKNPEECSIDQLQEFHYA